MPLSETDSGYFLAGPSLLEKFFLPIAVFYAENTAHRHLDLFLKQSRPINSARHDKREKRPPQKERVRERERKRERRKKRERIQKGCNASNLRERKCMKRKKNISSFKGRQSKKDF